MEKIRKKIRKMAIIKCLSTNNLTNLNKYLLDSAPHETTDVIQSRNLMTWGQNIMKTYDHKFNSMYISSQEWAVLKMADKRKKRTKGFHLIMSFSDDDFPPVKTKKEQAEQTKQAYKLVSKFLKKELPDTAQYVAVIQRDGDGHKLHAHIALNSVQMSGRTLATNILSINRRIDRVKAKDRKKEEEKEAQNGQKTKKKEKYKPKFIKSAGLYERFQNYLADNFEQVTKRKYKKIERDEYVHVTGAEGAYAHRRGKEGKDPRSWRGKMIEAINDTEHVVDSLDEFKAQLDLVYKIEVKERKASYTTPDGVKHKRRAFTYCQKDDDGKIIHKARDFRFNKDGSIRGLGKLTTPDNVEFVIDHDVQLRMAQEEEKRREQNRQAISYANDQQIEKRREQEEKQRQEQLKKQKQQQRQNGQDDLGF